MNSRDFSGEPHEVCITVRSEGLPAKNRTTRKDGDEATAPGIGIVHDGCIAAELLRRILDVVKTRGNSSLLLESKRREKLKKE